MWFKQNEIKANESTAVTNQDWKSLIMFPVRFNSMLPKTKWLPIPQEYQKIQVLYNAVYSATGILFVYLWEWAALFISCTFLIAFLFIHQSPRSCSLSPLRSRTSLGAPLREPLEPSVGFPPTWCVHCFLMLWPLRNVSLRPALTLKLV